MQLKSTRLVHRYSNWRRVHGGPLVPFSQDDDYPEEGEQERLLVDTVQIDRTTKAASFAMPPQPHDHLIRGHGTSTTVPYDSDGSLIFVPVRIDGKGPYPFLLDTGGHLRLTSEVAAATGQSARGGLATSGPAARVASRAITVSELSIGDAVLKNQHATTIPLKEFGVDRRPKEPMAGVIGLELFTRFTVRIDRRRRTVTLTLAGARAARVGVPTPVVFSEDVPMVRGAIHGKPGLLVVDSGNSGSTIINTGWAERRRLTHILMIGIPGRAQAIGGALEQVIGRADVRLGRFNFPHEVVSFLPLRRARAGDDEDEAGNVGQRILSHFNQTWDYARGVVWLEYLPEAASLPFNRSGLGLTKNDDGTFDVALVVPGSPAEAAGIAVGDVLKSLNGRPAETMTRSDASALFTAPVGTTIRMGVCRKLNCREIELRLREVLP